MLRRFRGTPKKSITLLAVIVGAAVLSAVGLAGDVWSLSVSQDTNNLRLRVQHFSTSNFDSGWHTHPGLVVVNVEQGSLTWLGNNCVRKTYGPGDTFVEVPYTPARVTGVGYAKFTATFVLGHGDPLASPAPAVTCP